MKIKIECQRPKRALSISTIFPSIMTIMCVCQRPKRALSISTDYDTPEHKLEKSVNALNGLFPFLLMMKKNLKALAIGCQRPKRALSISTRTSKIHL